MNQFTRPLRVSPLPHDSSNWCLRRAFRYDVGKKGSGKTIVVESGFVTDFASIPRLFWLALPKWGRYGNAAVVHDYLYWLGEKGTQDLGLDAKKYGKNPRKQADRIMREGMEALGVPAWKSGRSTPRSAPVAGWPGRRTS